MPAKRLATEVKRQKGSFVAKPKRENKLDPKPKKGWPEKTEVVLADPCASEKWDITCQLLHDMNVLTVADRDLLELFCINWSQYIACVKRVSKEGLITEFVNSRGEKVWKRSPWTSELGRITDRQHKLLVEFGLTPSTRSKLVVLKGGESESPFDKWIERGGLN